MHNLLAQFSASTVQTHIFSETEFFDMVASQNDHISPPKQVFNPLCVFFIPCGHWMLGWGHYQGTFVRPTHAVFSLNRAKMEILNNHVFDIVATHRGSRRHGARAVRVVGVSKGPTHPVGRVLLLYERSYRCRICALMCSVNVP